MSRGRGPTRRELAMLAAAGLFAGRGVTASAAGVRPGVVGTAALAAEGLDRPAARRAMGLSIERALGVEQIGRAHV